MRTSNDRQSYYITYTIVIQAEKIDVDFRSDSLATNKRLRKELVVILITFYNRVFISFFKDAVKNYSKKLKNLVCYVSHEIASSLFVALMT